MRMHKRVGAVFLLLVVAAAAIALMSPIRSTESVATAGNDGVAAGDAGMRVYLDPETGDVLEEPDANIVLELDPDLANAMRRDTEGLQTVKHANGAESIGLDGRYQEATIVHIDENGKRIICTDNVTHLENALNETTSTTPEVK